MEKLAAGPQTLLAKPEQIFFYRIKICMFKIAVDADRTNLPSQKFSLDVKYYITV